jgi:hypothetical protein
MLSVVPCCAFDEHEKQDAAASECCEGCSPFYTCGTCTGFTALSLVGFSTLYQNLAPNQFNNRYLPSFAEGMNSNIWQPPKLS